MRSCAPAHLTAQTWQQVASCFSCLVNVTVVSVKESQCVSCHRLSLITRGEVSCDVVTVTFSFSFAVSKCYPTFVCRQATDMLILGLDETTSYQYHD